MAPPPRNSRASAPVEAQTAAKAIKTRRVLNICADAWADIVAARTMSDSVVIFIVAWKEGEGGIGYDGIRCRREFFLSKANEGAEWFTSSYIIRESAERLNVVPDYTW